MKILNVLLIILSPILCKAQEYPVIDTLNFGVNVKEVIKYSFNPIENDTTVIEKYIFNKNGEHVLTYSGYNYESQSKTAFIYSDSRLIKVQKYEYTSPENERVLNHYYEEFERIIDSVDYQDYDWSALHEKYSKLYKMVDPEKINWEDSSLISEMVFSYDLNGYPSQIEIHDLISDQLIYLSYNSGGKLERWVLKDIPQDNVFNFQAFKPNTAIFDDSIKNISGSTTVKEYEYFQDSTVIKYFVNDQLNGIEYQLVNPIEFLRTNIVTNVKGDTLSVFAEHFDDRKLLVDSKWIFHSGYNGFGYSTDLASIDEERYSYDNMGILKSVEYLENNDLTGKVEFKISKNW